MPNKNALRFPAAALFLWSAQAAMSATPWSEATHQLAFGDFNGDGRADVLYVAKDHTLPSGIALSDGISPSINHQSWASNHLGIPWHSGTYKAFVADFNGDTRADILLQRQSQGDHYLLFSNSTGQINAISQTIPSNLGGQIWSADAHRIVVGDFDGNGRRDVFLQALDAAGLNAVYLASASGTFSSAQQTWGNSHMGFRWSLRNAVVHAGDFNGDAKSDLLVQAKPDIVMIDYDVPFPVPVFKPGSFGIASAKTPNGGGEIFYSPALQIWDRNYLGLDWSAANFDIVIGNFDGDGSNRDDIFLQARNAGRQNRLLLAGSGGQFTSGDSLPSGSSLANLSADQYRLHAARFGSTGAVGLYAQAKTDGGTNQIFASALFGSAITHDPNLINAVTPGTAVGAIPGEFSVDPSGAANYKIAVAMPPGVAGLAPEVALVYSSRAGNGTMGVGWQLAGLSAITRCPTTSAQDGVGNSDGVDFDGNDAFCLDGQRLMAVTGTNGSVGAEYRTEVETHQKVTSSGSTTGDPDSFTVWDKAGLIREYGTQSPLAGTKIDANDSRFEARFANGTPGPGLMWAVKIVRDRFDNFIEYKYDQDPNSHNVWPVEISYGSKLNGAKTVVGRVVLTYTSRVDTRSGYMTGGYVTGMTKRLQKVSVYGRANPTIPGANDLVRQYYLDYEYSSTTKLSHLIAVTLCDGGQGAVQRCFKSSKFQWQYGYRGFTNSSVASNVDFGSTVDLKMMDADGDGRSDYVYRHAAGQNTGQWLVRYASLVHSKSGNGSYVETNIPRKQSDRAFSMDWNNDGYPDLVEATDTVPSGQGYGNNYRVLFGGPGGLSSSRVTSYNSPAIVAEGLTYKGLATAVGDFDGDGRQDFAYSPSTNSSSALFSGVLKMRLNNSAITSEGLDKGALISATLQQWGGLPNTPTPPAFPWQPGGTYPAALTHDASPDFKDEPAIYTINFDGDGRDDLLVRVNACYYRFSWNGDITTCLREFHVYSVVNGAIQRVWGIRTEPSTNDHLKVGDFNGDGLSDILVWGYGFDPQAQTLGWHLDLGTGSKGANGVPAFKSVMAATSAGVQAECSDVDYAQFEYSQGPGYAGSNCSGATTVLLTEALLDSSMPFDYNRDGYTDLIAARNGYWQVLPGGPTGYVEAFINTGREARQAKHASLVDDAGDGLPDILFPWGSDPENNWHVYYGRGPAVQGVVEKITDGLGAQTTIQYLPLNASNNTNTYVGTVYKGHTRFAEDPNSATQAGFRTEVALGWPNAHAAGAMPVVHQYIADNGIGAVGSSQAAVRTTLEYWGLKTNREGRGSLGFAEIRSWNDNSEIETRNRFAQQAFPLYGMLLTSEQRFRDLATFNASLANGYNPDALLLNYASACDTNPWCSQLNPGPGAYDETAAYKRVAYTTNLLAATQNTFGNGAKTYLPYVRKSTNETHPVSAGVIGDHPYKRIVTEHLQDSASTAEIEQAGAVPAYDTYGNVAAIRITTTNGSTGGTPVSRDEHIVLTSNTFTNDTANWCLARLTGTSVTHSKPLTNTSGNGHASAIVTRSASFTYQSGHQCVLQTETTEPTANGGQLRMSKTFSYDTYGNRYKETIGGFGVAPAQERVSGALLADGSSSYAPTQGQFPSEKRNALGHAEMYTWEGLTGSATHVIGPNGLASSSRLDSFGRKKSDTPIASLSAIHSEQTYYWCANTGMCWDSRSIYALRSTSSDGKEGWIEFDRLGRAIATHDRGFDGNWIATEKYFDPLGREYLASHPYKPAVHSTRCWNFKTFDVLGRPTSAWDSYTTAECTANIPSFSDSPSSLGAGRLSEMVYDIVPNPGAAGSAGSNGIAQRIVGNASDTSANSTRRVAYRLTNVVGHTRFVMDEVAPNGCPSNGVPLTVNSSGCIQTEYDYDAQGNLTYTRQAGDLGGGTNSQSRILESKVWFNLRGFKSQLSDPDMGLWTYEFNSLGETVAQTDAKGQTTSFEYDKLGRLRSRIEKLPNGTTELSTTWEYDTALMGIGKLAGVTASDGYAEWLTYDAVGRVVRTKRLLAGSYYYLDLSYDAQGRLEIQKFPGSVAGDTSNGPEADPNRLRVRNSYNSYGFLASVEDVATGANYWRADAVNERGVVTQETLGNAKVTKRYFDRSSRHLGSIKTGTLANENEIQNLEFGFDQAANLRIRKDQTADVNGGNGIREEYNYDSLYRLTQMRQYKPSSLGTASPTLIQNYTYDVFGNLLTKGTSYSAYCYNSQAAGSDPCSGVVNVLPHAAKRVIANGTARDYLFDANGHVVSATNALYDSVSWYVSHGAKRVQKGTKYTEFAYGPDRVRYRQHLHRSGSDSETTIYVGDAYERLTKTVGAASTVEHTHYIRAGEKVIALAKRQQNVSGTVGNFYFRYLHRDHIGSVVALTDGAGTLVERSGFDPWGKRTSYQTWDPVAPGSYSAGGTGSGGLTNGTVSTKRGFTGHEHVEELGFVHMNGRIYDAELGRFFSPDPTMQFPESTQGQNRYSYAGNNPLSIVDPSGFSFAKVLGIIATILQFIPVTSWIGFILNVVVGFMQGGVAGGLLAIASAFVPGGGNIWSQLAIGAAKSLVSNTILGAANGYQVSLGQSFKASVKGLPKAVAIQAATMAVGRYVRAATKEASASKTEVREGAAGDHEVSGTQNGANTETFEKMVKAHLEELPENPKPGEPKGFLRHDRFLKAAKIVVDADGNIKIKLTLSSITDEQETWRVQAVDKEFMDKAIENISSRWNKENVEFPDGSVRSMSVSLEVKAPGTGDILVAEPTIWARIVSLGTVSSSSTVGSTGRLNIMFLADVQDAAHEFGHPLGFRDAYRPGQFQNFPIPGFNDDVMGNNSAPVQSWHMEVLRISYSQ
jgi:RHS repeat-associated protein